MRQRAILYGLHLVLLLTAGCSGFGQTTPEPQESQSDAATAEATSGPEQAALLQEEPISPPEAEVSRTPAPSAPPATSPQVAAEPLTEEKAPVQDESPMETAATPDTSPPEPEKPAIKPGPQEGETPVEALAEKPAKEPVKEPVKEPAPPPLDLDSLEQRLRETKAIGVFTKLALKNQVDDLLDKFRDFYQGRSNASLAQLKQPYEMLIMKVLALLQDSDPTLASELLESREAIWKVLSDREKFTSI